MKGTITKREVVMILRRMEKVSEDQLEVQISKYADTGNIAVFFRRESGSYEGLKLGEY